MYDLQELKNINDRFTLQFWLNKTKNLRSATRAEPFGKKPLKPNFEVSMRTRPIQRPRGCPMDIVIKSGVEKKKKKNVFTSHAKMHCSIGTHICVSRLLSNTHTKCYALRICPDKIWRPLCDGSMEMHTYLDFNLSLVSICCTHSGRHSAKIVSFCISRVKSQNECATISTSIIGKNWRTQFYTHWISWTIASE